MKFPKNTIQLHGNLKHEPEVGSWDRMGSMQQRKRKGLHYNFDYYGSGGGNPTGTVRHPFTSLTPDQMWNIYQQCSDVRAAVDSIVRRVATYDWNVIPTLDPKDENYLTIKRRCDDVKKFFNTPNSNGYTFQEVLTSMLTDCLVFDSGVFEIVYDRAGDLKELVPLRGSSVVPMIDEHGKIIEYIQDVMAEGQGFYGNINLISSEGVNKDAVDNVRFKTDQILFLSLFPNTANPSGNPLLESLINEVISVMRASQHAMLALDADEIPPGILVLAGIAGKAAEQAKADLKSLKGQDHKIRVMTTPDPQGMAANWLELRRTPKELSMRELVEDIRRSIYRVFGVQPVEMGMTEGMPRATAHVQLDVSTSHLVTPILELLQAKINHQIIPLLVEEYEVPYIQFIFDRDSRLPPEERNRVATAHQIYVKNGVMSRNEIRDDLGLLPVKGGDVLTLEVAGMPTSLDAVVANKVYPVNIANQPQAEADAKEEEEEEDDVIEASLVYDEIFSGIIERSMFGVYEEDYEVDSNIEEKLNMPTPDFLMKEIPIVMYPSDFETEKELEYIKYVMNQPIEKEFIEKADDDMSKLFIDLLIKEGAPIKGSLESKVNSLMYDLSIFILKLKYKYNRARPYQVAEELGVDFNPIESESAKTPSYPSGHAIQAFYMAHFLSEKFPKIKNDLYDLAEKISWSRVQAGVHYMSDIVYGRAVYEALVDEYPCSEIMRAKDDTNFPKKGDNLKVSLRNSKYPTFPKAYAAKIKAEYPSIWGKGGNIKGNDQYSILTKIRDDNNGVPKTASQEKAIRLREAWAARHLKDFRLAGVVAQMKWLVIGSKGLGHMKSVINDAIDKLK